MATVMEDVLLSGVHLAGILCCLGNQGQHLVLLP